MRDLCFSQDRHHQQGACVLQRSFFVLVCIVVLISCGQGCTLHTQIGPAILIHQAPKPPARGAPKQPTEPAKEKEFESPYPTFGLDILLGYPVSLGKNSRAGIPFLVPEVGFSLDSSIFPYKFVGSLGVHYFTKSLSLGIGYIPSFVAGYSEFDEEVAFGMRHAVRLSLFGGIGSVSLQYEHFWATHRTHNIRVMFGLDVGILAWGLISYAAGEHLPSFITNELRKKFR